MAAENAKLNILSSTSLKLLACAFMLVDHIGVRFFPHVLIFRIIGRLAFPLFAFFIGEGCRHTANRLKHFLCVFVLGLICESVYIIYTGAWYGNILLTFSVSILLIYLLQYCREKNRYLLYAVFAAVIVAVAVVLNYVNFDYGFFGILLPIFAAFPGDRRGENVGIPPAPPGKFLKAIIFASGIMLTSINSPMGSKQLYALLAVPLLVIYSGNPGKKKLKYFFYIFYPLHLLLIEAVAMLIL